MSFVFDNFTDYCIKIQLRYYWIKLILLLINMEEIFDIRLEYPTKNSDFIDEFKKIKRT
jgi:hypothetical protein